MHSSSRRHPWVAAVFAAMLFVMLGFGAHAGYMLATRWIDPAPQVVEGWMTPRLIVLSFGLPPDALLPVLGVAGADMPFATLDDIAATRGTETKALITGIDQVIAAAGTRP